MTVSNDGGILSAEQVATLQEKYPTPKTPAERREAARLRKQAQRTREKEKAEIKAAMSQAEDIQAFWSESLKQADPEKVTEWQSREEQVVAQLGAMRDVLEGRAFDDEFIEDVATDTKDMLSEFGEAAATPVLLLEKFWQEPNLLAQLTKDENATAIFAKYGILIALPDIRVHEWEQFIDSRRSTALPAPTFTTIACSCGQPTSVSVETARAYATRVYRCGCCIAKDSTSRAAVAKALEVEYSTPENQIRDSWGRIKL